MIQSPPHSHSHWQPKVRLLLAGATVLACAGWMAPMLRAAEGPDAATLSDSIQRQVSTVFAKCRDAVVRIESTDDQGELSGSGFFIGPDGMLYTSYTVGGESRDIIVLHGNVKYPATRIAADARSGVAILKVEARTPFLAIGKSRDLSLATPVLTVGFPMDLPMTPSFGLVAGFDQKFLGRFFATTHIRANVPVQRGQGGAPLLDLKGNVVGILISSLDEGSALFALPIEAAEKVRRDVVRFGHVRPGWIGIDVGPASEETEGSFAEVRNAIPGSPAEKAGIQTGDVLLQVGETKITTPQDVLDASFFLTAEDQVSVRLVRGDKQVDLQIVAADSPSPQRAAPPTLGTATDLRGVPDGTVPGLGIGK